MVMRVQSLQVLAHSLLYAAFTPNYIITLNQSDSFHSSASIGSSSVISGSGCDNFVVSTTSAAPVATTVGATVVRAGNGPVAMSTTDTAMLQTDEFTIAQTRARARVAVALHLRACVRIDKTFYQKALV